MKTDENATVRAVGNKIGELTVKGVKKQEPYVVETSVPKSNVFERLGFEWAWTKGKEHFLEFTELRSGVGMDGSGATDMLTSFDERVKEFGGEELRELIMARLSVEEQIAQNKVDAEQSVNRRIKYFELKKVMGGCLVLDGLITVASGKTTVDIIKTDNMLKSNFGNEYPCGMSMKDFVTQKWGAEVTKMFTELF